MKKIILLFICVATCYIYAVDYAIIVNNKNPYKLTKFPVVLKVDFNDNFSDYTRIIVKDFEGKNIPAQWDDFNQNGKVDAKDEITLLANLKVGENKFTATFVPEVNKVFSPSKVDKSWWKSIDNKVVKLSLHKEKISLRNFYFMQQNKWQNIASYFVLEPKMENSWNWKNSQYQVSVVANGPVRKIISMTIVKENPTSGKKVKLTNNLSIFSNRKEILSQQIIENISHGQLLEVNSVNTGMYQVFNNIKGKNLFFAGKNNQSKVLTGNLATGSFLLKNPTVNQDIWCKVYNNDFTFAMAIAKADNLANLLIRTIPKQATIRMSLLYQPKKNVVWPNQSLLFDYWFIVGNNNNKDVERFAKSIKNISGELLR